MMTFIGRVFVFLFMTSIFVAIGSNIGLTPGIAVVASIVLGLICAGKVGK